MDPMEFVIAHALDCAGLSYETDSGGGNPSGLDFRLAGGVEIEVKRFHTPRVAEQMARAENVIVAQGEEAVRYLAHLIRFAGIEGHRRYELSKARQQQGRSSSAPQAREGASSEVAGEGRPG